jgi:membrane-associated protease RseP (regulator of RpoE activity)
MRLKIGPMEATIRRTRWTINLALFVVTVITTTAAGSLYAHGVPASVTSFVFGGFLSGWVFSAPLMLILLVHEMGHYLTGRRRYLDVTPPYFLPAPPPLGTFGAFIKIRSPITNRRVLVEIGASGPLAGAVVAIPLLYVGLCLSEIRPAAVSPESFSLGSSLILELLCLIRFGQFSSHITVILHPTALAAWFGLFVTAMNLLPIGQLDGGHVVYALFGQRVAKAVSVGLFGLLIAMGIMVWPGWLIFGALVFFLGLRHPSPLDPYMALGTTGRVIGWAAVVLFTLTFIPVPFS